MCSGGLCRGTGVFSRAGPTDAGDECIRGPAQRRRDYGPVDFAGLSVPGMQFSAAAEVHSSAVDLVDDTLVCSRQ